MGIDFLLQRGWKLLLIAAFFAATGLIISTFLTVLSNVATNLLPQLATIDAIFLPYNFNFVLTTVMTVRMASTVYESAIRVLNRKQEILR